MKQATQRYTVGRFFSTYAVPIMFIILSIIAIPLSHYSVKYLTQELITRLARNLFLVLSLLIPVMAGMGLNFGMVLGAMGGQIALIFVTDWGIAGLQGLFLAMILSTPLSILFGYACGAILNRARGREMVTSFILGFFANGIYQLVVLYGMGSVIPMRSASIVLSRGYGIRNAINLAGVRHILDNLIVLKIGGISIPIATFLFIALFMLCFSFSRLSNSFLDYFLCFR